MKPKNFLLACALCGLLLATSPKAEATQIPPEVQAEFDRLIEIEAGDILDQYLSSLPEDIREALVKAEEEKWAAPTVPASSQAQAQSGLCGVSVNWSLSETGVLTITGTGEMFDFREGRPAP